MKTKLASSVLVAALLACPALVSARDAVPADRAVDLLARNGSLTIKAATPYVQVGSFLVQVALKLGQPTAKLADGTWLYQNFRVEESEATGTLVVRFNQGRVSGLTLVTPAVANAMMRSKTLPAETVAVAHD